MPLCATKILFLISLPYSIRFLNLYICRAVTPDQGGPDYTADVFCNIGAILVECGPPLGSSPFPRHSFILPELLHSWDPLSSCSSASDMLIPTSEWGGSPAMVIPILLRDHVNNQPFSGVTPQSMSTETWCQVEDNPRKLEIEDSPCDSEGRQPFNMDMLTPCPTGAIPPKPFRRMVCPCG